MGDLKEHYATKKHKNNMKPRTPKRFNCEPCRYGTDRRSNYNDHCRSQRHKDLVAEYEAEETITEDTDVEEMDAVQTDPEEIATAETDDESSTSDSMEISLLAEFF